MRFGLLTQWYDPEPGPAALPGALARGLHDRGHEVQVVTAFPNYPNGRIADGYHVRARTDEWLDNVAVRRTAVYPSHDDSTLRRLATYTSFGLSSTAFGVDALRGCDALWVNYSPITVAWPMWVARYGLRIPSVVHVLDLWPDTVLQSGFAKTSVVGRMLRGASGAWCHAIYASADSVGYISPGVGPVLAQRGVPADRLHYVPMWADEAVFHPAGDDLRAELGIASEQVVLLYGGSMGVAQGLEALLDAAATIEDPRLVILLAGSGTQEAALRDQAARLRLPNVRFIGRVPQERMTALLGAADASYVSLRAHALSGITMPSKIQAGLAAGKPLIVAADGDARAVVEADRIGLAADPSDATTVAAALKTALDMGRPGLASMGSAAREVYERDFSLESGVGQIEKLLMAAAERAR